MPNQIKVYRGVKASMPTLAIGELGLATDTFELFVGTSAGNKSVSGFLADAAYLLASADSRLVNARVLAAGNSIAITDGGAGSTLTIDTVQDIRTTATPTFAGLYIIRDGSGAYLYQRAYASSAWGVLVFDRARGTSGAPTVVQSGDILGGMQFRGWDGSDWGLGGFIYAYAAENFSTTAHGTYLRFYTVPAGSTSYYERMRINHDGVVYVYSTADPCLSLSGGLKIASYTGVLFASSGTVSALAATGGSQYLRRNAGNTAYEWAALAASDLPNHASRHESGGADAITGNLDANARIGVRVNSGATTYKRRRINFIPGTSISFSMSDDSANEEVDLTISVTGGGGGGAPADATYLLWTTPDQSLPAARFYNARNPLVVNKDTDGEYKISSMVPIGSETAAVTLDAVTLLYSDLLAVNQYDRLGSESHVAWAILKSTTSQYIFAGAELVLGTYSVNGMQSTTTPQNIVTWNNATSLFRVNTEDESSYVQVDLGAVMSGYIFAKFRLGVYSTGTAYAKMLVSANGTDWTYVNQWSWTTTTGAYIIFVTYRSNVRYIRMVLWKSGGTYAFLGTTYSSAAINKIFFFKQGRYEYVYPYEVWYTVLKADGSLTYSDDARKGILSLASYGPTTTAPTMPSGLTWGLSVCIH